MKPSHVVLVVVVASGLVQVEAGGERWLLGAGQSRAFGDERPRQEKREERRREGRRPAVRTQRGILADVGDNKLTLTGDRRESVEVAVTDATKVFIDGKPAKLAGLAKGMMVIIERGETDAVLAVRAEGPTIGGVVKSVGKDRITIKGRARERQPAEDVEYPLAKELKVTIDGKPGAVTDLKEGDAIGLGLSADKKAVLAIVKGRGERRERQGPRVLAATVKGTEKSDNTITVFVGERDQEHVYPLAKAVKVVIDGKEAKLEDVKERARVQLTFDKDDKTVTQITIGRGRGREGAERREGGDRPRLPTVAGKVAKAFKDGTITVTVGRANEDREFAVAKDAKVTLDGKAAKPEDVKEGTAVTLVLDAEQKTVKEITVAPARRRERE